MMSTTRRQARQSFCSTDAIFHSAQSSYVCTQHVHPYGFQGQSQLLISFLQLRAKFHSHSLYYCLVSRAISWQQHPCQMLSFFFLFYNNIKIKFSDFKQITRSRTVNYDIQYLNDILGLKDLLIQDSEIDQFRIRLLGLTLSNLHNDLRLKNKGELQLTLEF